jgi:flagellar basal-body rod protein FlgF
MSDAIDISEINLINSLRAMELIGQNIANANVAGYKRERLVLDMGAGDFDKALAGAAATTVEDEVPRLRSFTDFKQGSLAATGGILDIGIEGDGLFVVQTPTGIAYSRAGNLSTDEHGRLLLNGRYPVLGENGEITLTTQTPKITQSGEIYDGEDFITRIKLGFPEENDVLVKIGETLYQSANPLSDSSTEPYSLRQGYLESSNIQQVDEMVSMMKINRQVEMTQRVIRGYDEMVGEAISTIAEF